MPEGEYQPGQEGAGQQPNIPIEAEPSEEIVGPGGVEIGENLGNEPKQVESEVVAEGQEPVLLEKPELTQEQKEGLKKLLQLLSHGNIGVAKDIIDTFFVPAETVQQAAQSELIKRVSQGHIDYAKRIIDTFSVPKEFLTSTEVQQAAQSELIKRAFQGNIGVAKDIIDTFSVPKEFLTSTEVQQIAQSRLIKRVSQGYIDDAKRIIDTFSVSKEFLTTSTEVQQAAQDSIADCLSHGRVETALKIIDFFKLTLPTDFDENFAGTVTLKGFKLISFIPYLADSTLINYLPKTMVKIKKLIFSRLNTDQDLADYFAENLDKYYQQPWVETYVTQAITHFSVAQKLANTISKSEVVWGNQPWAKDLFAKFMDGAEEGAGHDYNQDSSTRHGSEGFRDIDPYENHQWRFTGEQMQLSSVLAGLMNHRDQGTKLEKLGINQKEVETALAEINEEISNSYVDFLDKFDRNKHINSDDKETHLDESKLTRLTPLLDNIKSFVARYLVQKIEGNPARVNELGQFKREVEEILAEGFQRYLKVHEVDIPLYDKLYEEFDNLRETGRNPLEVYLGRDGIYAYVGRRAQDVARRKKLGREGRQKLRQAGEVLEINPKYVVYPRYFRDNINYDTKRQFLEQEGISLEADPLFYDTGYTGTVPEQIMRVMDFDDEEIERRIKLLSAPSAHRRVKGIAENARNEIIEYIEHNAKLEQSATGLTVDKTTGKIRHIAEPTSPEEQFYFMMVKQALARHYWLKEKLHHEPSGNINLDSEHHTIRIRQEYAELLPPEFIKNPQQFLMQHGELLKGSKGEGEYPDEEIILFTLADGTEIVAKRIELRKAKEARKEFSILIAAKKAGLPTAEPVGFLSGKQDNDGSYLLMKKLEGHSGRKFEQELRDSGKYSDEKIQSIMQQVAEKNKEMAELFRTTLKIDKRWRIKDTIIEFNDETGKVESVIPIDWERAQNYNPDNPKEID